MANNNGNSVDPCIDALEIVDNGQTSTDKEKSPGIREAELNLKILKIKQIFDTISNEASLSTSQEIVAFLGPTKAGKSTLINLLMGNPLKCVQDPDTEDTSIVSEKPGTGPVIGSMGESETTIPKSFSTIPGTNWTMWDFPGFGDNKGTDQEIANAAAYEKVLRHQKAVRFVLVVPNDLIAGGDPMPFYKLLNDINSICPNYSDSLSLIATKAIRGKVDPKLQKLTTSEFSNADNESKEIVANAKKIIGKLVKNKRCADFRSPPYRKNDVDEITFLSSDLKPILDVILGTQGTNVSKFPLAISKSAKHDILEVYTSIYQKVKKEVEDTCLAFTANIQQKITEIPADGVVVNATAKLAIFKSASQTIMDIKNKSKDLKSFFESVKPMGTQIDSLAKHIDNYIFIENIRNMYKTGESYDGKGEKEFFKMFMLTLNQSAQKYSELISTSEAASEEEKKYQQQLQEIQMREQRKLEIELEQLSKENEALLVRGAKFVSQRIVNPICDMTQHYVNPIFENCRQQ